MLIFTSCYRKLAPLPTGCASTFLNPAGAPDIFVDVTPMHLHLSDFYDRRKSGLEK